ncbi:hypothetical protein K469DRAFT_714724 [Zopfia rhizophila CBS 207.26]|uniref:Uncharacterized protein n=1 Tax=Zopfia rhizophila CBS 207.26 TaxID=1314779 RepID=A0A6A6DLD8_9PEZI|nr:hypothetical protein K469DRAFT_714724 [Zopfia rhizophila CBS 207.26]
MARLDRQNCFIVSMAADVIVHSRPDWKMKKIATFELVDDEGIDEELVMSLVKLLQTYQRSKHPLCIEGHVNPKYSSIARRPDVSAEHDQWPMISAVNFAANFAVKKLLVPDTIGTTDSVYA